MAFGFITGLSESKLFPTKASLKRKRVREVSEFTYLYLITLSILFKEDETDAFARNYARRTLEWGNFDKWRQDASDLYVLLHTIKGQDHGEAWDSYPVDLELIVRWLRDGAHDDLRDSITKRLFTRLDFDLKIKDEALRAIRRKVQDWDDLGDEQHEVITKLLHLFKTRMFKSELLPYLTRLERVLKDKPEDEEKEEKK